MYAKQHAYMAIKLKQRSNLGFENYIYSLSDPVAMMGIRHKTNNYHILIVAIRLILAAQLVVAALAVMMQADSSGSNSISNNVLERQAIMNEEGLISRHLLQFGAQPSPSPSPTADDLVQTDYVCAVSCK